MSETIDFLASLNREQLAAVQAGDGPVLIIAAAGTGKTRTLVYRVAHLIQSGVHPGGILLLTFTNRAAREMVDRARDLVGRNVNAMWGGTFHHVANRILRRHAPVLGFRNDFTILDSDDARKLMRNVLEELELGGKEFPKAEVLLGLASYANNTGGDVQEILAERFMHHPADIDDMQRALERYTERKKDMSAMDFDDLLIHAVELFRESPELLDMYRDRFQYVLVDEYQDTNLLQAELVDLLAAKHRNLLVVGDDFQSIYAWRGANFQNILDFPKKYKDTQIYKLETNYRSVPQILDVANQCIAGNPEQFQKTLRAVREPASRPILCQPHDGGQQARYVIDQVRHLRREGYKYREMAILYRSHFSSMEMQLELAREQIPFTITSGVRFFEQAHVKDVVTLLRLMHSPADELAFVRLLTLFPRVGDRTARKIWNQLKGRFYPTDAPSRLLVQHSLPKGAQEAWAAVDEVFAAIEPDQLGSRPHEVVFRFVDGFYDKYALDNFENYPRRMEDLQELETFLNQFSNVEEFLNETALLSNVDSDPNNPNEKDSDSLRLSTIHQAKGLEWKVVFILWIVEGLFPAGRSLEEDPQASEERRLFYVAVTRAEDNLFLMAPKMRRQRDGGTMFYNPSRFLSEIDPSSYEKEKVGFVY